MRAWSRGFLATRLVVRRWLLARVPFAAIDRAASICWIACAIWSGRTRSRGVARYDAGRIEAGLGFRVALRTMSAEMRENWLDQRLYAGRALGCDAWPDLRDAGAQIASRIRQIQAGSPGRPVILSPFHYVSQYANIYVVDEVRKALDMSSISVVSGVPRDIYGNDSEMIPSLRILYTYDEKGGDSRNGLGLRVIRSLRRDGVAVVFSDVPPFSLARFPMETVGVTMNGKNARIHSGVFRLGAPVDALLLPFYLRFEGGRFSVEIGEVIALAQTDAPQRLAETIQTARKANYPHWLFAGHPSTYHFAPTR